jgi:predicted transcriptional regulator
MDDQPQIDPADDDNPEAAGSGGREARLGWLRSAVKQGLEDIKAGRVDDLEAAFERIEAMLDELEAAKRSGA